MVVKFAKKYELFMTNNYYRMRSLNRLYSCDAVFAASFDHMIAL